MKVADLIKLVQPGDIGLTSPKGEEASFLWKAICWFQKLEDGVDECKPEMFSHLIIFDKEDGKEFVNNGGIYESVLTIRRENIAKYIGSMVCVIRNLQMTQEKFFHGREEIFDNLGHPYPFHHLIVHAVDVFTIWGFRQLGVNWNKRLSSYLPLDWPVCSELGKQFCNNARVETGIEKAGWKGVNPDDFDDARINRPDLWLTVAHVEIEE